MKYDRKWIQNKSQSINVSKIKNESRKKSLKSKNERTIVLGKIGWKIANKLIIYKI